MTWTLLTAAAASAEMSTSSGLISMHALEYSLMISRPSDDHVQPSAGRPGTSIGGRWPSWLSACRGSGHRWTRRLACRSHSPRRSRGLARRGAGMGAARPTLRGRCGPAGIAPRRRAAQAGEDLHRPGRLGRGPDHRAEDAPAGHPVDPGRAADRDAGPSADLIRRKQEALDLISAPATLTPRSPPSCSSPPRPSTITSRPCWRNWTPSPVRSPPHTLPGSARPAPRKIRNTAGKTG